MKGSKTPSFTAERQIMTRDVFGEEFLWKKMDIANRLFNDGASYCWAACKSLYADAWYQYAHAQMRDEQDEEKKKEWVAEIWACAEAYGLTEYNLHAVLWDIHCRKYPGSLNADIVQKLASELYASVKKAIFRNTKIHCRKYGKTCSLSGKKANSGIIFYPEDDRVRILGHLFCLKPIRETDRWLMEALKCKVKYCRVVRRVHNGKQKYFLQLILKGQPPEKIVPGKGTAGLDPGVSTAAVVSEEKADFFILAQGIEKYDKQIRQAAVKYDRRRRMANPDCYNPDGTIKKGARFTNHTKGMERALLKLQGAYRKKKDFIKNSHGRQTNRILESCGKIITEPMDYKALAKRSKKEATRQSKISSVKKKNGKTVQVRKFKRKKRFGTSVQRRAPGLFRELLKRKATQYGIPIIEVDIRKYRASQYDHETDSYKKPWLSDRTKKVNGRRVQRDLYSGFLLKNFKDQKHADRESCRKEFRKFLKHQGVAVAHMIQQGDTTGNFGLRDFLSTASA